jgi:hypothetical protein
VLYAHLCTGVPSGDALRTWWPLANQHYNMKTDSCLVILLNNVLFIQNKAIIRIQFLFVMLLLSSVTGFFIQL